MTLLSFPAIAAVRAESEAPCIPAAALEDARNALETLLELGMRILDGQTPDVLALPPALALTIRRLDAMHATIQAAASRVPSAFAPVLARHAEHRRRADTRELDLLSDAVASAERPKAIGRSVVVTALTLLSNLGSDERWFEFKRIA